MSGQAINGGHVVCLRDADISEMKTDVRDIKKRMYHDNGHESIQTSLATGAARFKSIDEKMTAFKDQLTTLSGHVASLADVVRQANTLQQGMMGEGLTTEGLVREVLKRIPTPAGQMGGSNTVMWGALAVISVCATIVFLKVW